jgi:FMN phosphatase YigB (HAD superfamily)
LLLTARERPRPFAAPQSNREVRLRAYILFSPGVARDEILHAGQSQFTDMVGAKPLGLTVAWINRRNVALDPSVPKPDLILPDVASLLGFLDGTC